MVAQIVTKQKAALPPGMVSLQNMEVVCPWPGKSLPEEKLSWQPDLVLRHVSISCLYIDVQDGRAVIPSEVIDAERGRVFIVLAGELMAEVLGHFPWEFERMMDNVIAFERGIGMPEKKIGRR